MNKGGFVKWWWDDSIEVHTHNFEGLDEGALGLILQEEGVEAVSGRRAPGARHVPPEQMQQMEAHRASRPRKSTMSRSSGPVSATKSRSKRCRPKNSSWTQRPPTLDDAMVVGHRTMSTVSDLVALGYDRDMLDDHLSDEFAFVDSDEYSARYSNTEMPGPGIGV